MPLVEEFDKAVLPRHLSKDARENIEVAAMLGWAVHVSTSEGVTITAPGDPSPKRYHFGKTRSTIPNKRIMRDIVKFGDPALVAIAAVSLQEKMPELTGLLPKVEEVATAGEVEEVHTVKREPRHIVSREPMIAKARPGDGYMSATTIVRKWSDGSTDYECRMCDYTSPVRLGVPRHFGALHSQGPQPRPPTFQAEVPEAAPYKPRKSRIEALAAALRQVMDGGSPEDVALAALTWVREQSRQGTELSVEREEMTDTEVLNRIRTLLDRGEFIQMQHTVEQLQTEVRTTQELLDQAIAEADECRAVATAAEERARRAHDTLVTLSQLAREAENEQ